MRPLTFSKQKALAEVTQLFWRQGYEGTSVQQILHCMRLNRSSLYSAFGDKRALFVKALEWFSDLGRIACAPLTQIEEPREAITQFYNLALFSLTDEQKRSGCLLVNTILEQSGLDEELASLAADKLGEIERAFKRCFELAQAHGNLSHEHDPERLASFFMILTKGLRVAAREGRDEAEMRQMINISLNILD